MCISIGVNDGTIVFRMFGYEIDERLEVGTPAPLDLDIFGCLGKGYYLTHRSVELHNIDLLNAILEEAVDGGIKVLQIFLMKK